MKEIGKLIELYYEHKLDLLKRDMRVNGATKREIEMADIEKVDEDELEENLNKLSELRPFIKWLVDNDKIDRDKKEIEKSDYDVTFTGALTKDKKSDLDIMVDTLLMLLSISNSPIEDLLLYLK